MATKTKIDGSHRQRRRNPISPEQRLATDVETTANLLGISRRKIYDLIATGELQSFKLGGRRLISRRAREKLIAEREAMQ